MPLTYEHVGSKKPAKINTNMLTRAALLITLCYEIPCILNFRTTPMFSFCGLNQSRSQLFKSESANCNRSSIYPSVLFSENLHSQVCMKLRVILQKKVRSIVAQPWLVGPLNSRILGESINLVIQTKQRELLTSKKLSSIPSSFSPLAVYTIESSLALYFSYM